MSSARCGHVALAGAPNVGKSSLLNALVGQHLAIVSPKAQATRLPVVGLRTEGDTQYIFHDLPGLLRPAYLMQERMREIALETVRRMDLVLHLHPAPDAPAPPFEQVAGLDAPLDVPVLAVYTKGDLVAAQQRAELVQSLRGPTGAEAVSQAGGRAEADPRVSEPGRLLRGLRPLAMTEAVVVSTTTGHGLDDLLERIRPFLPEAEFEYDPDDIGTQPLRFFVVEYLREAAFALLGDEVPYAFTAAVEEFREADRPVYIRVTLYVERESQKAIVIGRGGQTIKALGAHTRTRLEALIGAPVYLDSWVKVLPRWRRNPAALARFGFPEPDKPRRETPHKEPA